MNIVTVDKDGLIFVLLFLLCVAVSYIVDEFINKRAEQKRKQKGQIFKTLMRTAQTKIELLLIIFDESYLGAISKDEFAKEFYDALIRIDKESRKEDQN